MSSPTISVIMPAYNVQEYVAEAVQSVLAQTFEDFEFLICDDGSSDRTPEILRGFAARDPRVRLSLGDHTGYTLLLNRMLGEARGGLVARMDADDVCLPHRFATQLAYLKEHPECVALGARVLMIDPHGGSLGEDGCPLTHEGIEDSHLKGGGTALTHPVTMFRRDIVRHLGGYRSEYEPSEDLDLWLRLAEVGRLVNLGEPLLRYRRHPNAVGYARQAAQAAAMEAATREAYRRRGLTWTGEWKNPLDRPLPEAERLRIWGWRALMAGNVPTARRYAFSTLRRRPLSPGAWKLTACAIRGY